MQSFIEIPRMSASGDERVDLVDLVRSASLNAARVMKDIAWIAFKGNFILDVVYTTLNGFQKSDARAQAGGWLTPSVGFIASESICRASQSPRDRLPIYAYSPFGH